MFDDEFEVEESMLTGLIEGQDILIQERNCVVWVRSSHHNRMRRAFRRAKPSLATYFDPMDCCDEPEQTRLARVADGELRICRDCIERWSNDFIISQAETPASLGFVS